MEGRHFQHADHKIAQAKLIVLDYLIFSSEKFRYSSGPVLAAHRQRGTRTHYYVYIYVLYK
jgi:hypothetical protein